MTINSVYALEEGVSVPLVADKSTGDGEEGLLLGAQVIVTNGTGHVFVDTNPYTQVDLQGSARIAAMVASDVLGIDEKAYDFYYIIDISSPIIGGPSAGGALTVATIAAINKWPLKSDVVMTGMINPDESIGPVGGIPFKLEAAAAKNATLFLIPEGQSTVTVKKTNTDSSGSIITIDTEETVDVVELGKKLNVTVKEVSTIQDVVREFTGYEITKPTYKGTILTTQYMDLLKPLARNLKNESGDMYKEMESTLPKTQFLVTAKDILDRADKMYDDNKYYAATSLYFNSMYTMRFAQWNDGYDKASDKEQYLTEIINRVEKQINFSENDLRNFTLYGISDAEAVGAAESRITTARMKLDEAKKLTDTQEKITSLAFAHERARTAQWWLTLATPDGKIVPEKVLKDRAGWYLSQAQSINTYMFALVSETGSHPEVTGGAGEDLDHAQKEMERGYYAGAIFDSLQATTKASTLIGLLGKTDAQKKVGESYEAAKVAINEARLAGIEPTLAVSAYEYGETMTNPYEQISQYSYARTIAKTSIVLKSHSIPSNQTPVKPVITPYVSMPFEPSVPAPNVTVKRSKTKIEVPGFEAVMAVSILFIARRLYKKNIRK
ncbi:MAG: S16 family serine protease [Candidatus Methanoperedens sp.]